MFEREVYETKKVNVSYCGWACYVASKWKQVEVRCRICDLRFTIRKSMVGRIVTCGPICKGKYMSLVRLSEMHEGRRQVAPYRKRIKTGTLDAIRTASSTLNAVRDDYSQTEFDQHRTGD